MKFGLFGRGRRVGEPCRFDSYNVASRKGFIRIDMFCPWNAVIDRALKGRVHAIVKWRTGRSTPESDVGSRSAFRDEEDLGFPEVGLKAACVQSKSSSTPSISLQSLSSYQ
jgi:hypothetical protein